VIAIVILRSTRGTAGSDIWYTFLTDQSVGRSYHPRDYAWRPLKAESLLVIVIIPSHPWLQWYSYWWSSPYNGDYIPGALLTMSQYEPIKLGYCCASLLQYALSQQLSSKNDVDLRRLGIAGPFVDDSITGRGVVLGRAATKLRSIETHPLTGGSTYQKLPLCGRQYVHLDSWGSQFKDERFKLLTAWTGYGSSPLIVIPWWVPGFSPWGREELVGWSRKKWLAFEILLKKRGIMQPQRGCPVQSMNWLAQAMKGGGFISHHHHTFCDDASNELKPSRASFDEERLKVRKVAVFIPESLNRAAALQ